MTDIKNFDIDKIIDLALQEDLPAGDITTDNLGVKEKLGLCLLIAKQNLVLSGSEFFSQTIKKLDSSSQVEWNFKNGDLISAGDIVCTVKGNLIELLKAERVGLNFLGHLSGIATFTKEFVEVASKIKILDTRKTFPLFRSYEKQAVCDGGGANHRMNLSDAVLIKENHICAVGSLKEAILNIKKTKPDIKIEVEVKSLEEAKEAVEFGAYRLLLDNMTNEQLEACVKEIPKEVKTEASGNMSVERVKSLNHLDLDYISVGAITHSAPVADFSLLFQWN